MCFNDKNNNVKQINLKTAYSNFNNIQSKYYRHSTSAHNLVNIYKATQFLMHNITFFTSV